MIEVSKSICICGRCGAKMEMEWDLDPINSYEKEIYINSYEKSMGIATDYESVETIVCQQCGNIIIAKLWAAEYPPGTLEDCAVTFERDDSEGSTVEKPRIEFFDL